MNLHSKTPRLLVNDPRGLTARTVDYCRAQASLPAGARIQLTLHDASGRATQQWDPRLWRTGQANLVIVHSISNKVLSSVSVDAGWRVNLAGDGEQLLEQWDGRGTRRQTRYDQQLRPLEVFENEETAEQFFYGDETSSDHNQCGRLIRHEDSAGVLLFNEYGLNGAVLEQERRLIHDSLTGHVTRSRLTPLGDLQIQTDAQANTQRFPRRPLACRGFATEQHDALAADGQRHYLQRRRSGRKGSSG
jgi:insecticidal toxin complex protein TccC